MDRCVWTTQGDFHCPRELFTSDPLVFLAVPTMPNYARARQVLARSLVDAHWDMSKVVWVYGEMPRSDVMAGADKTCTRTTRSWALPPWRADSRAVTQFSCSYTTRARSEGISRGAALLVQRRRHSLDVAERARQPVHVQHQGSRCREVVLGGKVGGDQGRSRVHGDQQTSPWLVVHEQRQPCRRVHLHQGMYDFFTRVLVHGVLCPEKMH